MPQDVDWSNVRAPEPEPEPKKSSAVWGILGMVVFLVVFAIVGGGFLTMNLLGKRIKQRAIDVCDTNTNCVLDVRQNHDGCFADHVVIAPPAGVEDFQTGDDSDHYGVATADWPAYRTCVGLDRPRTLQDEERVE